MAPRPRLAGSDYEENQSDTGSDLSEIFSDKGSDSGSSSDPELDSKASDTKDEPGDDTFNNKG